MRLLMISILLLFLGHFPAYADIQGEEVEYSVNDVSMKGYLVYDDSIEGKRPGVLVVHEWWGHNDYARKRARMLAELGYTAFAVDMYGDGKQAEHPEDAGKFSSELLQNLETAQARFEAALELLRKHKTTDPERIAAIGYCFGGAVVLHMARRGVDLDGVVSFHGIYTTEEPAKAGKVKASVLVLHGADDQFMTKEQIDNFKEEMKKANVDFKFISYPDAKHSFTVPEADAYGEKFNIPVGYNAEADKKSWAETQNFLKTIFEKEKN